MSKFADKIRRVSRFEAQPLGFVTARATKDASMVLAGIAADGKSAASLAQSGADVVIMGAGNSAVSGDLPGAIAGAWLGGNDGASALKAAGFDFAVFDPDKTPSTAVLEEEIGYVMALPADMTDVELRSIEAFQLDAIDVGELTAGATVRKQIDLRRIFALTRKPLMARVPADITTDQLQALRDTNVAIVAIEGAAGVAALRKTIDALPPRARRRDDERAMPVIPRSAPGAGDSDEDDDDDDHD